MKTTFIPREISEIPNDSIILLNNKRCKVRNLIIDEAGAYFLALPETFVHGDANVMGKKVECSNEAVFMVEEERSRFDAILLSSVVSFCLGMLIAGIITFVRFHVTPK